MNNKKMKKQLDKKKAELEAELREVNRKLEELGLKPKKGKIFGDPLVEIS